MGNVSNLISVPSGCRWKRRPQVMQSGWEYNGQVTVDSRKEVVLQLEVWMGSDSPST
jgi:hypothetical protein